MDDELTEQLVLLGLRRIEARAYLALVRHGTATAAEVADSAAVSRPKVYEALKVLEREGFCLTQGHNVARYQAVAPAIALAELGRRRQQARAAASKRDEELTRSLLATLPAQTDADWGGPSDGYMVATVGGDKMLAMFEEITQRARSQLDVVLGSPQIAPPIVGLK